jgi:hypothetical protein
LDIVQVVRVGPGPAPSFRITCTRYGIPQAVPMDVHRMNMYDDD